jgi:hypothetical protein
MKYFFNQSLTIFISGIFFILTMPVSAESLKDTLKAAKGGKYATPTVTELREAEALFIRTLKGEQTPELKQAWQTQGFIMQSLTQNDMTFTVVQEAEKKRTGRGFYLFRQKDNSPIALQAPHSYKDLYTGSIARRLMEEGTYVAAGWNTVKRNYADIAHLENTIFQAFGRAFAKQYPMGTIVQLHGFVQGKRKTKAGKTTDLILSSTTITPSQYILEIGKCLKSKLTGFTVRIYPYEISELGGTKNSNAKDLWVRGFNRFFHIEMSKTLRKKLRNDKQVRGQLNSCFK